MSCLINFTKNLFTFLTSLFDVGSDVVNSLAFMGYNISSKIVDTVEGTEESSSFWNVTDSMNTSENDMGNNNVEYRVDFIWGVMSMVIVFLPGMLASIPVIAYSIRKQDWILLIGASVLSVTFPITFLILQFAGLFFVRANSGATGIYKFFAVLATGLEASVESSCQLALQMFTRLYGYPPTTIQTVTMIISFFQLSKCSITQDIEWVSMANEEELGFKDMLKEAIKRLPCYVTTIIFRVSSVTLTMAFLRMWSVLPMTVLFIGSTIIGFRRNKSQSDDNFTGILNAIYLAVSNIGVMNAYALRVDLKERAPDAEDDDEDSVRTFVRQSSIVTFLHHTIALSVIIILSMYAPAYLPHLASPDFQLKPSNPHFFTFFGFVFLMGCYSLTVILYRAENLSKIER